LQDETKSLCSLTCVFRWCSLRSSCFPPCHVAFVSVQEQMSGTFDQYGEPWTNSLSEGQSAWIGMLLLNQAAWRPRPLNASSSVRLCTKITENSKVKRHISWPSWVQSGRVTDRGRLYGGIACSMDSALHDSLLASGRGGQISTVLGQSCGLSPSHSYTLNTATAHDEVLYTAEHRPVREAPLLTLICLQAPPQQSQQSRGLTVRQQPIVFPPTYGSKVCCGPPPRIERPCPGIVHTRPISRNPGGRRSGHTLHPRVHIGGRLGTTRGGAWCEPILFLESSFALVTGPLGHTGPRRGRRALRPIVVGGGAGRPAYSWRLFRGLARADESRSRVPRCIWLKRPCRASKTCSLQRPTLPNSRGMSSHGSTARGSWVWYCTTQTRPWAHPEERWRRFQIG